MYSQNQEEMYILDYFKDKYDGKFIDIGAYHVFRFSNTRALYEKGWSGVLVEPAPGNYTAIRDHYEGEERIVALNFAVGVDNGIIDFYESNGDAVGTTDIEHMKKWEAGGVKYTKIQVHQLAADAFFASGDIPDFLSIDTEGTNIQLFRAVPAYIWEGISMLCIEHDEHHGEIAQALQPYGFKVLYTNAENIILAK